jgi:hypothetical protein
LLPAADYVAALLPAADYVAALLPAADYVAALLPSPPPTTSRLSLPLNALLALPPAPSIAE